jgi:integrase
MSRQYAREPLSSDEGNRLIQDCSTLRERQVILILLDTGLRVSELARVRRGGRDRPRGTKGTRQVPGGEGELGHPPPMRF